MKLWLIIAITSINMASLFTFCAVLSGGMQTVMTDVADWPASPWCDSRSTVDAGVSGRFPLDLKRSIAPPAIHGKPQSHGVLVSLRTCNCIHHPGNHQSFFYCQRQGISSTSKVQFLRYNDFYCNNLRKVLLVHGFKI